MTKSRGILAPRQPWSAVDVQLLREAYPDSQSADIAKALGRSVSQVYAKATALGLRKSEAFMASDRSGRVQRGRQHPGMRATQFKPGQSSWSKGLKGVVGVQEACRATQFKKGRPAPEAHNYQPIGSLRISKDGYLERKVTDDPSIFPARRWVGVHRLVWIAENGPVPEGHVIAFKPGRTTAAEAEITADAVECISRAENARRNSSYTTMPPELAKLVQLRGAITRQINKRAKEST